ncbi:zonular occludens toxin domain-containing protein [Variovorax sp. Varisp62]|uniref:zonular occludens toxin domain-containing protein n=1 Tax=Variovorax sp. Varisp62 TaxID=3243049 RepID=UPI0039B66CBC
MTDYALTGKKGTGKSKNAVRLIRDRYLSHKRRVATNLDIDLRAMFGDQSKATYVRVPDKPSALDLVSIGHGNPESYEEDNNGGLFLDELGTWLNTRTFADKGRADVLDFFAHGRKYGWDTWYIMQNVAQIDKQVRESFIEQTVRHTRFDKVRVPFVGGLLSLLFGEKAGFLPKFHMAVFRMGTNPQDLVANRATFIGKDLEKCYDTRQVFLIDYPHGTHSVLSPWHLYGRFQAQPKPSWWRQFFAGFKRGAKAATQARPALGVPDEGWSRVVRLCRELPPAQRLDVMARYARASAGR